MERPAGRSPDRSDVEAFCAEISPRLVGALVLQLGDKLSAEEVAQEALARAWEHWGRVSELESPDAWTFRVALNLASSVRRRRRIAARVGRLSPTVSLDHGAVEDRIVLAEALAALPARQRSAVILRHYLRFSIAESAEALRCAPGTVKSLTSQGIATLRSQLPAELILTRGDVTDG